MSHTLYATFDRPEDAERAAGALLDHGARAEDLSVVRRPGEGFSDVTAPTTIARDVTIASTEDVSPVSAAGNEAAPSEETIDRPHAHPNDPKTTAVHGTMIGAGLGAVIAIAALIVPGVGFVLGAGALASAVGGIVATAGMGAATGAIVGYLRELGVDEGAAAEYGQAVESGGAVLALTVPSAGLDEETAEAILDDHGAANVNRYAARRETA